MCPQTAVRCVSYKWKVNLKQNLVKSMKRMCNSSVVASTWTEAINWGYIRSRCGCNVTWQSKKMLFFQKKELKEMESSDIHASFNLIVTCNLTVAVGDVYSHSQQPLTLKLTLLQQQLPHTFWGCSGQDNGRSHVSYTFAPSALTWQSCFHQLFIKARNFNANQASFHKLKMRFKKKNLYGKTHLDRRRPVIQWLLKGRTQFCLSEK